MSIDNHVIVDKRKRNFVAMRIDSNLHDLLDQESQRREITLSDTIRRLCKERLDELYVGNASLKESVNHGIPDMYHEHSQYEYQKPDYRKLLYYK